MGRTSDVEYSTFDGRTSDVEYSTFDGGASDVEYRIENRIFLHTSSLDFAGNINTAVNSEKSLVKTTRIPPQKSRFGSLYQNLVYCTK